MNWRIIQGDCREVLRELPDGSVQCCVTSPPYWGLRDYRVDGQIGLEDSPEAWCEELVATFREIRRVLAGDGTLWLNLGDGYAHGGNGSRDPDRWPKQSRNDHRVEHSKRSPGLRVKPKDLIGLPWMVAFALRADGWWLREDVIWHKPSPMPESVADRCTRAHEYCFRLTKSARYFADQDAIREPHITAGERHEGKSGYRNGHPSKGGISARALHPLGANKRSVWSIAAAPFPEAHFATFPPALVEPMVLASSRPGDTVLDPFAGAGTTGLVALRHGRSFVGVELNPEYVEMARRRIVDDAPLLNQVAEA